MEFLDEKLTAYVEAHTKEEPELLSGHLQGQVLAMFSKMIQPSRILEIGTYTGYSALCLAEGLTANGKLYTIDINEELEAMVQRYIAASPYPDKIITMIGDATRLIPDLEETFDLVFIDADKENYSRYYDLVFEKVRKGGFIIADNVLWSGNVLKKPAEMDEETLAIDSFNKKVLIDTRVENVLFPVRDGLMVIRKI
jgi:caffeoyl-CoA O-methyltransferase